MSRVFDHIPDSHIDILDSKCYAHVATLRPDGRISNHPVCLLWDGKHVRGGVPRERVALPRDSWHCRVG
ncbi:MAG: hypothetical protein JRH17_22250 [Deltaproteobacteria bacterium]|nr:hypothetical protein [Deltaproteobacteria bacterium]